MWDKALLAAEHNAEMSAIVDRVSKGMSVNPTEEVQHSIWDDEVDAKQLSKSKKKKYIPLHTRISDYSIIEGEDYTLQKYISQRHYSEILTWHADKTNSVFSHVLDDYIYVMWLDDEYNVHCIERFKDADVWEEEKRFDANKNKRETDRYTSIGVRNGERSSNDSLQGVDGQSNTILSRTVGRTSIGENNRERGYSNSNGDGEERNSEELTDGNELTEAVKTGKSKHFDIDRERAIDGVKNQAWDDSIKKEGMKINACPLLLFSLQTFFYTLNAF